MAITRKTIHAKPASHPRTQAKRKPDSARHQPDSARHKPVSARRKTSTSFSNWSAPSSVQTALTHLAGKRVILTTHSLADTDALASGFALSHLLGPKAIFALPDRANSEARRLFGSHMGGMLSFQSARAQFPFAPIILLDCNDPSLLPQLAAGGDGRKGRKNPSPHVSLLIDHHALSNNSVRGAHEWVEPEAASCSELVSSLLSPVSPELALFLIWGILSDSAHLGRASPRTLRALANLLERAQGTYEEIRNALRHPPSIQSRAAVLEGLRQATWAMDEGLLVALASVSGHESHVADALVGAGADAAFAGTCDKKSARISARISPGLASRTDLPALMGQVGRFLGGEGGGHPAAAGATGPKSERLSDALMLAQKLLAKQAMDEI